MPPKFNPFRPGKIVAPGMFAGRGAEISGIENALFSTKHGNASHFLLSGERGIGKSSLLWLAQVLARGDVTFDQRFRFLSVCVSLDPTTTYAGTILKIGAELEREIAKLTTIKGLLKSGLEFVKRWEVFGVKYNKDQPSAATAHELLEELGATVAQACEELRNRDFDGIAIFIDEADKPPIKSSVGEFCKLFTEDLTRRGADSVCLGLAGQENLIQKMRKSHESSPRIFTTYNLEPLEKGEVELVIHKGLADADAKNETQTKVTLDGMQMLAELSQGYPHFVQQFAYSAFDADVNNEINQSDVLEGAFGENGAIHQLGVAYFHDLYFDKVYSDKYRIVLQAMAEQLDGWVTKTQLRAVAQLNETTLTNALKALRDRNIIQAKEGVRGVYRLPTKSFAAWIRAQAAKSSAQLTKPPDGFS